MVPSATLADTLDRLLELPVPQRAALAHGLLLSLEADDQSAEAEADWACELESRLAAADRGEYAEGDWRAVIARVRSELGQAANT